MEEAGFKKSSNPKDKASTARLDLSLFPGSAIMYGALAMTEGHCKYGGYNYRVDGVSISTYYAALFRHMIKFYSGQWADPETLVPHLASALACIAIIIDGFTQNNIVDDRPPIQDLGYEFNSMEVLVHHLQSTYPGGPPRFTQEGTEIMEETSCKMV